MQEVIITFNERGEVNIETSGFTGKECLKVKGDFEKLLGKARNVTLKQEAKLKRTVPVRQ